MAATQLAPTRLTYRMAATSSDEATERRRAAEQQMKLIRGFTHDVRNPLGAADGYLALLEENIHGPLTPAQAETLASARRLIGVTLHLVDQLLDLERVESGRLELHPTPTNLADVARDVVDSLQPEAEAKALRMRLAAGQDESVVCTTCDRDRARHVITNLVSNAVKYTPAGGEVVVSLDFSSDRFGDRRAMISVADTGPGISEAHQATLFDEFARFDTNVAKGSGIGLAISQRVARAMGGTIVVDSEVGRGSVFTFVLPAT